MIDRYVVDCGGKKSPTPIHLSFCHQVCISSPDEENFDEWDKKIQSSIIPPPTLDEAHVMVSHYIDECRIFSSYAPLTTWTMRIDWRPSRRKQDDGLTDV